MNTQEQDVLCIAVNTDILDEGVSRLHSSYAILSDASTAIIGNEWLCDKLYGVELLLRQGLELVESSRVMMNAFHASELPAMLNAKKG